MFHACNNLPLVPSQPPEAQGWHSSTETQPRYGPAHSNFLVPPYFAVMLYRVNNIFHKYSHLSTCALPSNDRSYLCPIRTLINIYWETSEADKLYDSWHIFPKQTGCEATIEVSLNSYDIVSCVIQYIWPLPLMIKIHPDWLMFSVLGQNPKKGCL